MATTGRFDWRTLALVVIVAVAVVVGMLALAEDSKKASPDPEPPTATTDPAEVVDELVLAVAGNSAELAAYDEIVQTYNDASETVDVELVTYDDPDKLAHDLEDGSLTADLFLIRHEDLAETMAAGRNKPLQDLLDSRGLHTSDGFMRDSITAFSADDDLQCLPFTASPMVTYINTELVDFDLMAERDLPTPDEDDWEWSLEEFRTAANFAARPRAHAAGVYIAPTLEGLAPFVMSGADSIWDDDANPRSLNLGSDGDATDAVRDVLEIVRDPQLTLTEDQLTEKDPLEWFKDGKLGIIAGYRDLIPELRATDGLAFDVLPMPEVGGAGTIARLDALCIANQSAERVQAAADFLVDGMVSDEAVLTLAETGSVVPTHLGVAFNDGFLQPGQAPAHARVFTDLRSVLPVPLSVPWGKLERTIDPAIAALFTVPRLQDDLEVLLTAVDEQSRTVLDPDYVAEPSDPAGSDESADSEDPSPSEDAAARR